jgi:hypothetical protein
VDEGDGFLSALGLGHDLHIFVGLIKVGLIKEGTEALSSQGLIIDHETTHRHRFQAHLQSSLVQ